MTVGEDIDEESITLIENIATNPMRLRVHPKVWEEVNTPFDPFHWYNATDMTTSMLLHD